MHKLALVSYIINYSFNYIYPEFHLLIQSFQYCFLISFSAYKLPLFKYIEGKTIRDHRVETYVGGTNETVRMCLTEANNTVIKQFLKRNWIKIITLNMNMHQRRYQHVYLLSNGRVLASSSGGPGFIPQSRTASYQIRYKHGTSSALV